MSNERATVNDSDLLASSQAGSALSRRTFLKSLASAGVLLYVAPSTLAKPASAATVNAKVVLRWNDAMLAAIPATRMPAPITNRALAIVHTAIYDAWTPYTERALPTQSGPTRRPESERTLRNKSEAISYAAYRTLLDLFPSQKASFDELMMSLGYVPADTSTGDGVSPSEIGNLAAQRVLDARRDDGSNQENNYADTTNYQPVNTPDELIDPNRWQPLRVGSNVQQFLVPHWGQVRPFGLSSGSELRSLVAGMLKAYDPTLGLDQHYVEQHSEVLKLSAELDDRTKTIAEYWAAASPAGPPGHWNSIAKYVSRRDSHDLDSDVKLFFVLNNAMMDSAIAAWDVKIFYDSIRPISAIRFLYAGKQVRAWVPGQGTQTIDGATWLTYIPVTPPHAEFVSAHSAVSRAAAEVLKLFTGSNDYGASFKQPAGASRIEEGTPSKAVTLSWETFTQAAQQAGMSRLFGGIHISDANVGGLKVGQEVAKRVWDKAQTYFNGS